MKNVPENELFSAYLDGELTAAEQAQVEQLLATSTAARQLLEELRTLSATLQDMPSYQAEEDLSERILQLAERRMLAEPVVQPIYARPSKKAAVAWQSILRRALTPRALYWSGMAVAVAVMLMILEPGREEKPVGDRLARAPEAAKTPQPPSSIQAAPEPADKAPAAETAREPMAEESVALDDAARTSGRPVMKKAMEKSAVARTAKAEAPRAALPGMEQQGPIVESFQEEKPGAEAPVGKAATQPLARKPEGFAGNGAAKKASGGQIRDVVEQADQPQKVDGYPGMEAARVITAHEARKRAGQITDNVLVVQCDISAEAARKQVFDQILSRQQIAWNQAPTADRKASGSSAGRIRQKGAGPGGRGGAGQGNRHPAAAAGKLDVVYVEATPRQIEGALADLAALTSDVFSIAVKPAPGVKQQQSLDRYNRRQPARRRTVGIGQAKNGSLQSKPQPDAAQISARPTDRPETRIEHGRGRAQRLEVPAAGSFFRADAMRAGAGPSAPAAPPTRPLAARHKPEAAPAAPKQPAEPVADRPSEEAVNQSAPADKPDRMQVLKTEAPAEANGLQQQVAAPQKSKGPLKEKKQAESKANGKGPEKEEGTTYRVLFVLRVVGSEPSTAAAASIREEPGAPAAKPAEAAAESQPAVKQ